MAVQRLVYGGRPDSTSFPARPREPKHFDAGELRRAVEALHDRLARVTIECLGYAEFLRRYDRTGALFYIDPPYYGCEDYYGGGLFSRDDFARLADILSRISGRFIMSINDAPAIRQIFRTYTISEEPVTYRLAGPKRVIELVISN